MCAFAGREHGPSWGPGPSPGVPTRPHVSAPTPCSGRGPVHSQALARVLIKRVSCDCTVPPPGWPRTAGIYPQRTLEAQVVTRCAQAQLPPKAPSCLSPIPVSPAIPGVPGSVDALSTLSLSPQGWSFIPSPCDLRWSPRGAGCPPCLFAKSCTGP